jgi:hypothetical protein
MIAGAMASGAFGQTPSAEVKDTGVPPVATPAPTIPTAETLIISELFVPVGIVIDTPSRTIKLPNGAVTAVPADLWVPGKLLNTKVGPIQLPSKLEPTLSLPKTGWQNRNSVSRVGSVMTVVRDNKVMTRNKLIGGPQEWANWCETASDPDRKAGVLPPGYKWTPTSDGRAVAVPMK